jgi:crossover junction endodeoxyribonuclease RuvC
MNETILGLDPGISNFGWAVYSTDDQIKECGVAKSDPKLADHQRMLQIVQGIDAVVKKFGYAIDFTAIEQMMLRNTIPAIIKGYGARMCVLVHLTGIGMDFEEYNPTTTKKVLIGQGVADKKQMRDLIIDWFQLKREGKGKLSEHEVDSFAQIAMHIKEGQIDCVAYDRIQESIDGRKGKKCHK